MVKIDRLTKQDIPQVINISLEIFQISENEKDPYHSLEVWQDYFDKEGLLLAAYHNNRLAGYVFFYHRDKELNSLHCWMAGVLEEFRGQGILKSLMSEAHKYLIKKGYDQMTINTYKEKFPFMYSYLINHEYKIYKEEVTLWQDRNITKSFFKKILS